MANAYSAPNFNIDTSTNVAGLTALKGSAPALTDVIYIYNGATLTIESAMSCLKIYTGQTSAGAAGANNRYGLIVVDPGVTVTFAGNATNTNSGIQMNPTTADASSLGCSLTVNGTAASRVTFTNDGNANDTNKKWTVSAVYGTLVWSYVNVNCAFGNIVSSGSTASNRMAAPHVVTNCVLGTSAANQTFFVGTASQTIDLAHAFKFITMDSTFNGTFFIFNSSSSDLVSGGSVDVSGGACTASANAADFTPMLLEGSTTYIGSMKVAFADIRPATVIPTGLAFTDPALDGELRFTITNIASYSNSDEICIHNNADNALLACIDVSRYNTLGYGIVPGLTNGVTYTLKSRATSDNNTYSEYSGTATGTPTAATFTDAAWSTLVIDPTTGNLSGTGINLDKLTDLDLGTVDYTIDTQTSTAITAHPT